MQYSQAKQTMEWHFVGTAAIPARTGVAQWQPEWATLKTISAIAPVGTNRPEIFL
jgi:hypothetical protein